MTRFYEFRIAALNYWINTTYRIITDKYSLITTDDLADSFECKWQNKSTKGHISVFCSLGEWASNITDILKDESVDKCYFENQDEAQRIYRYFTRFLLIVSEILTDFQDIYIVSLGLDPSVGKDRKKAKARDFLSGTSGTNPNPITILLNFINNVCKHKTQHIHKCNHHLPLHFANSPDTQNFDLKDYIHIENLDFSGRSSGIIMPELVSILNIITTCYEKMNAHFDNNPTAFEEICSIYNLVGPDLQSGTM